MDSTSNTISQQLVNFQNLTKEGKIDWIMQQPQNPVSLKWDRHVDDKTYAVTIQKQARGVQRPNTVAGTATHFYFLSILKVLPQPAEIILQLNSQVEPQYKDALENLYILALDAAKQKFGSIFNDLLKDL